VFVVSITFSDCSGAQRCPVLALDVSHQDFLDYCAVHRNLAIASNRTAALVRAMRAVASMIAEGRALSVTQEDIAGLMDLLTHQAEFIQRQLDAVTDQVV